MSGAVIVVYLVVLVIEIAAFWRVFTKAGEAGWGAIIPIYNTYLICKVAGRPGWWLILLLIPFINIIFVIIVLHGISKAFGHGAAFTIGLFFLGIIFVPILGFGPSQYQRPRSQTAF